MKIYHIDAFTSEAFRGNSAGVVIDKNNDLSDQLMQSIASELKHSETAFLTFNNNKITLRWFTPKKEVDLCGHATIAAACALWDSNELPVGALIEFETKSGKLYAKLVNNKIELDFPQMHVRECSENKQLNDILGITPIFTGKNEKRYLIEIEDPKILRQISPNFEQLKTMDLGAFMITCKSDRSGYDFLSRFFAPYVGINEDPVTGSAHCYLGPYWSKKLNKAVTMGFQESERTGQIECELAANGRIKLRGNAKILFSGNLTLEI